ncbi:MAG: hypothetical protein COA91_06315 [Robiginitomaculum sp.]|nr:MAG: hypothetical protein COA91_06315 [Robiginitomaculum sp.]
MEILYWIFIGLVVLISVLSVLGLILPPPKPPAVGRIVTLADGTQINTYTKGQGPAVVLIHGLPGSAQDWPETVDALVAKGCQVTWYDRAGYGHSSRRGAGMPHTLQANGEELDELIEVMGLKSPALVGWSFGGGIIQASKTARNPDTPFIALVAAVGPAMTIDGEHVSVGRITKWVMGLPVLGSWLTKATIRMRFGDTIPKRWVNAQQSLLLMPGSLETMRSEMAQIRPASLDPSDILTPTLVVHGTNDEVVAYDVGVDLSAKIPNAKLVPLEGVGHMLPLTDTDALAVAITEFATSL